MEMEKKRPHRIVYWTLSMLLSIAAVASIGYKWKMMKPQYKMGHFTVSNREELGKVLEPSSTVEFNQGRKPLRIPTGFFIQSFSFINANDVNIAG
jgi:hypothetical protein